MGGAGGGVVSGGHHKNQMINNFIIAEMGTLFVADLAQLGE